MSDRRYKYFAFISYSRQDSRAARWLQHRLEWFRFPLKLVPEESRPPHSKYVRPVYRDKTNLEVNQAHYWDNLKQAIDDSLFLILICSPNAARSVPVDKEVRHFLENGSRERALDHVIPVVLQGNVGTRDHKECLCRALLERGSVITNRNLPTMLPYGQASEQDGWENGFIGVASCLLQLHRESLIDHCQREKHKRANRIRIIAVLIALLTLSVASLGILAWVNHQHASQEERLRQSVAYLEKVREAHKLLSQGRPDLAKVALWAAPEALRAWEWGHLLLKADPLLLTFHAATEHFTAAEFNQDGTRILTCSADAGITVWDASTGAEILQREGVEARFTADTGRLVILLGNGHARVLDLNSGMLAGTTESLQSTNGSPQLDEAGGRVLIVIGRAAELWDLRSERLLANHSHSGDISVSILSTDGNLAFTASRDGKADIWDTRTRKSVTTLASHEAIVYALFSPTCERLFTRAISGNGSVWETATGERLLEMNMQRSSPITRYVPESVTFSPLGKKIAWISDAGPTIWDIDKARGPMKLIGHNWAVYSVQFSADEAYALTASGDGTARLWDAATASELRKFMGHGEPVHIASFSPGGRRILTASGDQTVRVWDVDTGAQLAVLGGDDLPRFAKWSPDGHRILTCSTDGRCRIWSCDTAIGSIKLHWDGSPFLDRDCFSGDGLRIVLAGKEGAKVYDARTGNVVAVLPGRWFAHFSPNGDRMITGSATGPVIVWDTSRYQQIGELRSAQRIFEAIWAPDGTHVAVQYNGPKAVTWNTASNAELVELSGSATHLQPTAFSPDGRRYAMTFFGEPIRVCDTRSGQVLLSIPETEQGADYPVFDSEGSRVAAVWNYHHVRVWDAQTGATLFTLQNQANPAFSQDGRYLATVGKDRDVRVWNPRSGEPVSTLTGHGESVYQVAFSSDSTRLVSFSGDRTAKVWNPRMGDELLTLPVDDIKHPCFAAFAPDGLRVATAHLGGEVIVWQAAPYLRDLLPGDASMSWEQRFTIWKRDWHQLFIRRSQN